VGWGVVGQRAMKEGKVRRGRAIGKSEGRKVVTRRRRGGLDR